MNHSEQDQSINFWKRSSRFSVVIFGAKTNELAIQIFDNLALLDNVNLEEVTYEQKMMFPDDVERDLILHYKFTIHRPDNWTIMGGDTYSLPDNITLFVPDLSNEDVFNESNLSSIQSLKKWHLYQSNSLKYGLIIESNEQKITTQDAMTYFTKEDIQVQVLVKNETFKSDVKHFFMSAFRQSLGIPQPTQVKSARSSIAPVLSETVPSGEINPAVRDDNFSINSTIMDLKILATGNPLLTMLLRFVGEERYFFGGPRPEMLLDFAAHYQALRRKKADYVDGDPIPQYTESLDSIKKLELPTYEENKGWLAYRTPRIELCAMQNQEIHQAYEQFEKVLAVLGTGNNVLAKNLRRVKDTLSTLNEGNLPNEAPRVPYYRF